MSKYYIVQKIGWQYNDEVYYRGEDEGGKPEKVFKSEKKANDYADELNCQELSGCEIAQYGYGLGEVTTDLEAFVEAYNSIFPTKLTADDSLRDTYEFVLPKMTLKQYKQLTPFLNVKFYEVNECDGE